jgi:hypothetical protein
MSAYIKNLFKDKPSEEDEDLFAIEYGLCQVRFQTIFVILIKEIERLNRKLENGK